MQPPQHVEPPGGWLRIQTVEAHTGGEPLRVVTAGLPPIPGATILAKRRYAKENLDGLRRALMWEPRGHADMYGAWLTEPVTPDGDVGVLFLHNEGFSTMCGHGVIALGTVLLDTGMVQRPPGDGQIRLDTPAGRVTATAHREGNGPVRAVSFENVPSYAFALDQVVDVPGLGRARYDVAFGGAFYAYVQAADVGLTLDAAHYREIIDAGVRIKQAVMAAQTVTHPLEPDLTFLYGVIFIGPALDVAHHSRNVCVFADGEVDRSPTGTGVSGRAALHHARGEIAMGQPIVIESILGSTFTVAALRQETFGPHAAIVPRVTGSAAIVGRAEWWIDPTTAGADAFILR